MKQARKEIREKCNNCVKVQSERIKMLRFMGNIIFLPKDSDDLEAIIEDKKKINKIKKFA